jgi:hypothetical protein
MKRTKSKLGSFAAVTGLFAAGILPLQAQTPTPLGGAGARPVAVLLCKYSDKPNTYGFTPAGILATTWLPNTITVNGAPVDNSISGLVQDASLGAISFQGTQAFGWFTLPNPLSSYPTGPDAGNACIAAAQSNGVNFRPFTYVAVYMNDVLNDATGEAWTATLPGPASPTPWNALVVGVRGLTSPPLVLHELGHILSNDGWHTDSYSDPLGGAAYLGDDPSNPPPFPIRIALVSPEWDASRRELMGFIPAASIATFSGGTQTYNISRLTQPWAGLPTVIEVPLPGGAKYVISARTQVGYDSYPIFLDYAFLGNTIPTAGVKIELFTSTTVDAHIEMSHPGGDPTSTDAVWLTGQTYMDAVNGITITVANFNPAGNPTAQITVTSGLSGAYKLNPQNAPGTCLDVYGAGTSPGTNVDIWNCNGGGNQSFNFVSQGNGIYEIQPSYATGLCLDVYGGGNSAPGTKVDVWSCTGGSNQKWSLISDGGNIYEFAPQNASGLRLDVSGAGTSNGTQVDVWTANSGSNQKWALTK